MEGEGDDRLADLCGREQVSDKGDELGGGGKLGAGEPEIADHVAHVLCDGAQRVAWAFAAHAWGSRGLGGASRI